LRHSVAHEEHLRPVLPVAVACETFAERWTPLILRELVLGSRRFNEIRRGVPRMSRTLLAQRAMAGKVALGLEL
jgi:DNA-binding HxlR family transcriptional regulator